MRYYIVAGEASGDLHASNLIKAIRQKDPAAEFRGCGGDLMRDAGAELLLHYKEMAFMGFWEVFVNLRTVLGNIKRCKTDILTWNPDVLVLVDYPGFNLRIAEFAKQRGLKTVYYISPQIWAWKKGRIKQIKRDVDEMMVILPFEKEFYSKNGMDVHYVGHPLLDAVSRDLPERPEVRNFRKDNGLDDREIIALLPGIRRQEVNALLPQMLNMAELFPQYQFVVSTVSWLPKELYDKHLQTPAKTRTPVETCSSASLQNGDVQVNHNVRTVCGNTYALLANAKAAIVASGTATLETAMIGTPQVVCYAGSEISYLIAKHLITGINYISLPNLIMDAPVVTELIQHDYNTERLEKELRLITEDAEHIATMKAQYKELYTKLGNGSASMNAAEVVVTAARK
jgi:lipid-A-disaccharide synthase